MKGIGLVAAGRIAAALLQTLILVLLARSSELREFGQFSVGFSIGTVIASVTNLGLPGYALRNAGPGSEHEAKVVRGAGTVLALIASVTTLVVTLVLERITPGADLAAAAGLAVAGAAAANVLSDAVSNINQSSLYSQGQVGRAVGVQLLVRVIPTGAVVGSAAAGVDAFSVLAFAYVASAVVGTVTSGRLQLRLRRSLASVRSSVQYWRESLWALLQQLDVTTVSLLIGDRAAGAYAAGFRLASPIHIVTASVSAIYVPRLARQHDPAQRKAEAVVMLRWGAVYTVALVIASPLAIWLGPLLLGEQYAANAVLFAVFVVNSALNVLAQLIGSVLWAGGEPKAVADATRNSTVLGLVLIIVFASLHLLLAVAIVTVVIQLVLVPSLWRQLRLHWRREGVI